MLVSYFYLIIWQIIPILESSTIIAETRNMAQNWRNIQFWKRNVCGQFRLEILLFLFEKYIISTQ